MGRAAKARRIAAAAAYGGGGLGLAGAATYGLLLGQAQLARRAIPRASDLPPDSDGMYGTGFAGEPLTLAMLGDSSAAGYGVERSVETPGALLAAGLAEIVRRPVRLRCAAVIGALSADLDGQVEDVLTSRPDVTVIMIGGNDVTHRVRAAVAVRHLEGVVRRLHEAGSAVVVGTCPDLGTIEPIQRPLRWVARRWSRVLAAAQTIAVVEAGGRSVSLGDLLGPEFAAAPTEMFAADRFHPSAAGYARAASALLPSVAAALGAPEAAAEVVDETVMSLPAAAAEAVDMAGTEVSAVVDGQQRGDRGRWVELRHRIRIPIVVPWNRPSTEKESS